MQSKLFVATLTLLATQAMAHEDKPYDNNGGHYDNGGFYHCHTDFCVPQGSRNQYRSKVFSSTDANDTFLADDWPYWLTLDGGCKTARTVVLENTSKVPVTYTNPRQCEVREGLWVDEYTGEEFTRAAAMEIDHIIPPMYANSTNGYQWDYNKRAQFSNDPLNLIPVGRDTAKKKRDRPISSYRPREEFLCEYARNWQQVSEKYELDLLASDTSRLNKTLEACGTDNGTTADDDKK